MAHKICSKVWHKGDEVTIKSEPYELHGGMFQDAVDEFGNNILVATPEHKDRNAERAKAEWQQQQDEFRNLRMQNKKAYGSKSTHFG